MRELIRRPQAKQDLIDAADYLAEHGSYNVSDRFLQETEKAFQQLLFMPGMGVSGKYSQVDLHEIRMWTVPHFPNYLIF